MTKKKISGILASAILVVAAILLFTGCPFHTDSLYGLKVAGDGTGGAIAVYEDKLGGNVYAQKISPEGETMWGEKGVLLVESNSQFYSFSSIQVISDGSGGAITTVPSTPSSSQPETTYHIFKISSQGQAIPLAVLERVDRIISDGAGGIILDYSPNGKTLSAIRIDSTGNFPWGENGVSLPRSGYRHQIASDGSGGAVIVWIESHYPPEASPGDARLTTQRIFAQKIDSQGSLSWGDGLLLYATPQGTWAEDPHIIGDGSGGTIVAWHQWPDVPVEDGSPEAILNDIYVQRVDVGGRILWRENGIPLEISRASENAFPMEPILVSDGSGGAIIVWRDMRNAKGNTANLCAQRIDAGGNVMWQPEGTNVSADAINPNHMIVSDGAGGAIVSYFFSEPRKDLHVQKLGIDGKTVWPENGVSVGGNQCAGYSIAPEGQGGVIAAWGVGKGMFGSEKAYVQRVSADGKLLWGEDGIQLNK
jgi:hypothetical protein